MMKKIFFLTIILIASILAFAQNRAITRGAEPGELYLTVPWYGIYGALGPPSYSVFRTAVYRISEHGQKVTIQYDADYFNYSGSVMKPDIILADATPGVLYAKCIYTKNYYDYTQLWVSFDYGRNWVLREENMGVKNYFTSNIEGLNYRAGTDGTYNSYNYAKNFTLIDNRQINAREAGLKECEFFTLVIRGFYHTSDCFQNYTNITVGIEYASGELSGFFPDIYRGGEEGEVYIHSWFPEYPGQSYKASFSADTGHTFRHVYVNENYQWQNGNFGNNQLLFMSDREQGVFYILHLLNEPVADPWGWHLKLCIHYYRDYGETLVDIYCHDVNKDYVIETCESVNDLTSEKPDNNSVFLAWTVPESDFTVEGYRVYRNHKLLTEQMITNTFYLDENLDYGTYQYNVLTFYTTGCISEISNFVSESVEEQICEAVNDLTSEKINDNSIFLCWSEPESSLSVEGYNVFRNEQLITEQFIISTTYLDENLPNGDYEYYVITYYSNGCVSDSSNHVEETIELEIDEIEEMKKIAIYPNPAFTTVTIDAYNFTKVEVYNFVGQLIEIKFTKTVDVSSFNSGIYFFKIFDTNSNTVTKRIVVSR